MIFAEQFFWKLSSLYKVILHISKFNFEFKCIEWPINSSSDISCNLCRPYKEPKVGLSLQILKG